MVDESWFPSACWPFSHSYACTTRWNNVGTSFLNHAGCFLQKQILNSNNEREREQMLLVHPCASLKQFVQAHACWQQGKGMPVSVWLIWRFLYAQETSPQLDRLDPVRAPSRQVSDWQDGCLTNTGAAPLRYNPLLELCVCIAMSCCYRETLPSANIWYSHVLIYNLSDFFIKFDWVVLFKNLAKKIKIQNHT